jgi:RNA polymerase sigma-70 factor (ECF subfamily)
VRRFFLHQTLGDSQLSDDLAQDTFIKAYTNIASFRGLASFQTWIMRIAYNVFYDYTRSRHQTSDIDQVPERSSQVNPTLKMDLYAALALLKPDERTCITLQLIDGYDIAAIAKITQIKEGTVKSHLSRGKEKLANYLRQNGYDRR